MKIKAIALAASTIIGAVGATAAFAADQSCGAGSCAKKAQMKKKPNASEAHGADKRSCDMKKNMDMKTDMNMDKKDQSCGAGSCAKKKKQM